ncbi:MAG: glycosyltransferase family 39 protein [Acidimicrobiia bacterium]
MSPLVGVIAALTTAFHLATANIWGYHRDEFYYLACGRRLAWGFVDHPPLTPALYRLADATVGSSELGLRIAPAMLHGVSVVLVALLARELGGDTRATWIAALAAALAPLLLTTGHFLGTVSVELVVGSGLALVLVRLVHGGDPRLWLVAGVLVGVGLLNKWTIGFVLAGLAVGLLVDHRAVLASPWAIAGAAISVAIAAPTIWWQAAHGWPQLEFAGTLRDYGQAPLLLPAQLVLLGAGAILAVPGIRWLLTSEAGRPDRFLVVAAAVALVGVVTTGGKPYYTAAILPTLLAAGAVATQGTRGWLLPGAVLALGGLLAPLALPLTPRATADTLRRVNPELGEMLGWEALARQVASLHDRYPDAGIVTTNYSEAGSIELLARGLPQPASGHNSYWTWGPPAGEPERVIVLGRDRDLLHRTFHHVQRIATVTTPDGVHNQEDGTPIWLAVGPRRPWSELWPAFRRV